MIKKNLLSVFNKNNMQFTNLYKCILRIVLIYFIFVSFDLSSNENNNYLIKRNKLLVCSRICTAFSEYTLMLYICLFLIMIDLSLLSHSERPLFILPNNFITNIRFNETFNVIKLKCSSILGR